MKPLPLNQYNFQQQFLLHFWCIYYHLNNYSNAKKFADISIELDSSISNHYVTRAKIYSKLDKVDLAKLDLIKAIELNPENEEANSLVESL